jgi:hypothetical protein
MVSPQVKREAVTALMNERSFGVTRACGLVQISVSLYRYRSRRADCAQLRERICDIAATKRRYGYRRVHILLRREGWSVNRKLTYRLYREAGLAVRRRKRKRIGPFERKPLPKPLEANQSWSMDFVSDGLADGRRLRCLAIVDDCTRECVAIEVDTSITGARVMLISASGGRCTLTLAALHAARQATSSSVKPNCRISSSDLQQSSNSSLNHLHTPFHLRRGSICRAFSAQTSEPRPQKAGSDWVWNCWASLK